MKKTELSTVGPNGGAEGSQALPARRPRPHPSSRAEPEDGHELLELAFDAVLVRGHDNDVITYWNGAAVDLYGWTAEEAVGRPAAELLRTRYPAPLEQIHHELLPAGRWEGELRQVTKDGRGLVVSSRWSLRRSADLTPSAIVEINRDVTDRRDAEERLQVTEDSFRLLISAVTEYAIFMLDPDGTIATWNEGAERIKGYTAREIIGRHFSVFYEEAEILRGKPAWALVMAERRGRFEDEGWRLRRDGSRFWANIVITALRDEDGALRGFVKVTRDITERRAAEERQAAQQREEAARLREHADRMARLEKAKGDFLNLASHELRGPLAVLKGYVSMFDDGTLAPDELPEVLPTLAIKVHEIELLVQQMLETARLEEDRLTLQTERFDLREATKRTAARFRLQATARHRLVLSLPDSPVMVEADRGRIETVIANLIENAIKYSPAGGPVTCIVAGQSQCAFLSVEDTGIGLSRESLSQLFKRFSRIVTPETAHIGGTGLGLYLSRVIAQRHGGDIFVESRLSQGSRFTLTLPALQ